MRGWGSSADLRRHRLAARVEEGRAAAPDSEPPPSLQRYSEQVMLVRVLDQDAGDVALCKIPCVPQVDLAVDLRRVGLRAAGRAAFLVDDVDEDVDGAADLCL